MYTPSQIEMFWSCVEKSESCWLWKGSLDPHGYGVTKWGAKERKAHRVSWELAHGDPPTALVLRTCAERRCVNPAHLYAGTAREAASAIRYTEASVWKMVEKSEGCWEWTGRKESSGYGRVYYGDRKHRAHRLVWEFVNGPIPTGMLVCHKCDNRLCCRPDHLFLGTTQENAQDKINKERQARGEEMGAARLTVPDVIKIRRLHAEGMSTRALAEEYGVDYCTVRDAILHVTWKHVGMSPIVFQLWDGRRADISRPQLDFWPEARSRNGLVPRIVRSASGRRTRGVRTGLAASATH